MSGCFFRLLSTGLVTSKRVTMHNGDCKKVPDTKNVSGTFFFQQPKHTPMLTGARLLHYCSVQPMSSNSAGVRSRSLAASSSAVIDGSISRLGVADVSK